MVCPSACRHNRTGQPKRARQPMMLEFVIDSFAGGGGASIAELLEFCRIVEDKAKDQAQ
jgi:hypothetical protein